MNLNTAQQKQKDTKDYGQGQQPINSVS